MWLTGWLGDAAGALIVAPMLVLRGRPIDPSWRHRRVLEGALVLGVLLLVSQVVVGGLDPLPAKNYPLQFLIAPVLTWAAVRLGVRGTAIAILVVSTAALVGALRGFSPFARASANESLLLLQVFMGIMALTSCSLAAAVSERREALAYLQRSTERAMAAEERVRADIAEFLHGRVQSRLLLAWNRLGIAMQRWPQQPDETLALVAQVFHELDEIREQDVRQASYLLHPSFIREGLMPAVYGLTERFEGQVVVMVEADAALAAWDTPIWNRLPEALRLAAFRIIEEALGNVVRHAQATAAHVTLGLEARSCLVITVEDNGHGFDIGRAGSGLGLASIESRVRQAGGRWQITSLPGKGTTVSVRLPLSPTPPKPRSPPGDRVGIQHHQPCGRALDRPRQGVHVGYRLLEQISPARHHVGGQGSEEGGHPVVGRQHDAQGRELLPQQQPELNAAEASAQVDVQHGHLGPERGGCVGGPARRG